MKARAFILSAGGLYGEGDWESDCQGFCQGSYTVKKTRLIQMVPTAREGAGL